MSHHPKPSNDIADILAGTLMVSRGTALDIMRDTLATTGTQCQWRQADTISMPDTWEADCGAAWTFTDGGPKDNEMNFCPRCGHSLKQIDNAMTHKNDPYASEAETQALLAPDTRTEAERKLDKMMDELGAWEQGAEPYPLLRHIALELLKKQLAEQPAQQEPPVKLKVTLEDRPIDIELAQYKRMFEAACSALGSIGDALGIDPEEGGAEPILVAISELKAVQPAQRKPLTDDELADLWFKQSLDWMEFARAIEAAHGITGEKK